MEVAKLKVLKANHTSQVYQMQDKVIQYYPRKIASEQLFIEAMRADLPIVQQHPVKEDAFSMIIQGKEYTERKAAGEAIIKICTEIEDPDAVVDLGEYRGFPMQVTLHGEKFVVSLKRNLTYSADLSSEPVGNIQRINNALERIQEDLKAHISLHERLENDMAAAKVAAEQPFPKEAELQEKMEQLNQLNHELENDPHTQERDEDEEELDEAEFEFGGEQSEEAGNPEELDESDEPEDPQESEEPDEADEPEEPEEPENKEQTVKPELKADSREESPPGNSFHRDNPARHEGGKPSILDGLRNYTPPARVAAPPDRKRQGVML